jgi:intein/homing endonuclease
MEPKTSEISNLKFGVYSPQEVLDISCCEITTSRNYGPESVYDYRLGTIDEKNCETCGQKAKECPGHFGHIVLNEPIVHPLYYREVVNFLRCVCTRCYKILISEDELRLHNIHAYKGQARFEKILDKLSKVDMCNDPDCGAPRPLVKHSPTDDSISLVRINGDKSKTIIPQTPCEIIRILNGLSDDDVRLLGFDPTLIHPRNLIFVNLLVMPTCCRPWVEKDKTTYDDDFSIQYMEIVKANIKLLDPKLKEIDRQKVINNIKFKISSTFNNKGGRATHNQNGRPIKSIKNRITGKDGQIRDNLSGKRSCTPETPVLLWKDGSTKKAEDVVVGDIVVGDDGLPRTVVDTLTGESPLYTVKQSCGDDYGISCEHILSLKYCGHCEIYWCESQGTDGGWLMRWYDRETKKFRSKKATVNLLVKTKEEALWDLEAIRRDHCVPNNKIHWHPNRKSYGTWRMNYVDRNTSVKINAEVAVHIGKTKEQAYQELADFRQTLNVDPVIDIHVEDYLKCTKNNQSLLLGVKLGVPIEWEDRDVAIDPYILGMWLGDGGKCGRRFTSIDSELIDYWSKWASDQGGRVIKVNDGSDLHYNVNKNNCNVHPLVAPLSKYNLVNNKHIPEEYIVNSVDVRRKLLAGLIDTDGYVDNKKRVIEISQCHEHKAIIDGAERIARSLGLQTSVSIKKTSWTHNGEKKTGTALRLTISGMGMKELPMLLKYKKCLGSKLDGGVCYAISVEERGVGRFCGFEVDGNHRFLLGDCTITHNCEQSGRTVIGPDPTLKFGELAVPREMAEILTVPERVTNFNYDKLQEMVDVPRVEGLYKGEYRVDSLMTPDGKTRINLKRFRRGKMLYPGDIIRRDGEEILVETGREVLVEGDGLTRNGEDVPNLKYSNRPYKLKMGWIVERKLQNGDMVLLNRQPTLHSGSMQAMKIIIRPCKTLRINLAITKGFNADGLNIYC